MLFGKIRENESKHRADGRDQLRKGRGEERVAKIQDSPGMLRSLPLPPPSLPIYISLTASQTALNARRRM